MVLTVLSSLSITNFTLTEHLEVDFKSGMTAITGETGAGKSLVIDALGMTLGDRGDTARIRPGAKMAEVAAQFDIEHNVEAKTWLENNDFDDDAECLIRRILTNEGRSRGYINGRSATMQQLRDIGEQLIDIHGQHEHQSLLRRNEHLALLDEYGTHTDLLASIQESYGKWHHTRQHLNALENDMDQFIARRDLLTFQVQELDQLAPTEGEVDELENQQQLLANADTLQSVGQEALGLCLGSEAYDNTNNGGGIISDLARSLQLLQSLSEPRDSDLHPNLSSGMELLQSAYIQAQEASQDIEHFLSSIEVNPARLQEVEDRLNSYYQLARKHHTEPRDLHQLHQTLSDELTRLSTDDNDLEQLKARLQQLADEYQHCANQLSKRRNKSATVFAKQVNSQLGGLGMAGASLELAITPRNSTEPHPLGMETVELLAQTNPGHPHRPLAKIASGGELSRFSLAIQITAAQRTRIPALIFDEVDVGIGGATAEVVGKLLRKLGDFGQVIAVTHLAQVASCAHQQMIATKTTKGKTTQSQLLPLDNKHRIDEIARMLGGTEVTQQTLAHAEEMLTIGQRAC